MTHNPFEIDNGDDTVSYIPDGPVPVPMIPPGAERVPPPSEPNPAIPQPSSEADTKPEAPAVAPEALPGAPLGGEGAADVDPSHASADNVTPTPDGT